jgi:hypothetical protein
MSVNTQQLTQSTDRPGSCWMVVDGKGRNAGVIERTGAGRFGGFQAGAFLGLFDDIVEAAEAVLAVHQWEVGQ